MQVYNFTQLPVYLPYDKGQLPFGDPISGVTATAAAPGVFTVNGYAAVAGDAISFSYVNGGSLPAPLVVGTRYYVVSPSGNTFSVAATKGGAAITTTTTGSLITAHLLSNQVDGILIPFKTNYSVVLLNTSGGALILQGAADLNSAIVGTLALSGNPGGPGTWNTIATVPAGGALLASLSYDWIRVSTTGTLIAMQN